MSENRIETAADEADSPSEETQEEICEVLSEGAGEVVDSEGVEEAEGEDELASPRQGDRAVASTRAARILLLDNAHLAGKTSLVLAQDRDRIIG